MLIVIIFKFFKIIFKFTVLFFNPSKHNANSRTKFIQTAIYNMFLGIAFLQLQVTNCLFSETNCFLKIVYKEYNVREEYRVYANTYLSSEESLNKKRKKELFLNRK